MATLCFVVSSLLFLSSVGESCKNDYSEYGFALTDHAYESIRVDRLISCYMACSMQPACQSLNYNLADKTCDLNNDTKYYRPKYFVEKPTSVYAENRDSGKLFGTYAHSCIHFSHFRHFSAFIRLAVSAVNLGSLRNDNATNQRLNWLKNNRAARAARFLVQFFDVVCQTTTSDFHI